MAGWATLWLGGIAILAVRLTLLAGSFIEIAWLALVLVRADPGAASWPGAAHA